MVTGAGRGIGRAVAVELAAAGMAVALVARSEDQLADTAQQVKHLGAVAVVVEGSIKRPAALLMCATGGMDPGQGEGAARGRAYLLLEDALGNRGGEVPAAICDQAARAYS